MPEQHLQCRAEGGRHYIDGLMVPWNETATVAGKPEEFAPGGLTLPDGFPGTVVPFRYGHPMQGSQYSAPIPIGVLSRGVDTAQGLWTEWELLDSPTARDAWAAADSGAVDGLSPEFTRSRPVGQRYGRRDVGQGRVTDAVMVAGSLTEHPVYDGARVVTVRARTPRADELAEFLGSLRA